MRNIDTIVVHCTATPEGRDVSATEIDSWHKKRGWRGIGYHAVVRLNGETENGRDFDNDGDVEEHVGAHTRGHNARSLAVVYAGGLDSNRKPKDTRTPAQKEALFRKVEDWLEEFNLSPSNVKGHYEFANKACPCFDMDEFRSELTRRIKAHDQIVKPVNPRPVEVERVDIRPQRRTGQIAEEKEPKPQNGFGLFITNIFQSVIRALNSA